MNNLLYILDSDGKPVPEPNVLAWAQWFATAERVLARTDVGPATVSTAFLGTNHAFTPGQSPVLWETAIFGPHSSDVVDRYATREAALAGHERHVQRVQEVLASRTVPPPS